MKKNQLIENAKTLLASKGPTLRVNYLRSVFEMRYSNKNEEGSSFAEMSLVLGQSEVVLRSDIKAIWRLIDKADKNFLPDILGRITKATQKEWPFVIKACDISNMLGLQGTNYFILKDVLRSSYLVPQFKCNIFAIKRKHMHYLSSHKKINSESNSNSYLAAKKKSMSALIAQFATINANSPDIAADLNTLAELLDRSGNILIKRIGLDTSIGSLSLQESGQEAGGITRERVRQLCAITLRHIRTAEKLAGYGPLTNLKALMALQAAQLVKLGKPVISFEALIASNPELNGFTGNEKGLYLLCKMLNIENIMRSGGFWLSNSTMDNKMLTAAIKDVATKAKTQQPAKKKETVIMITKIPVSLIDKVRDDSANSRKQGNEHVKSMNDCYSEAVEKYVASISVQDKADKTIKGLMVEKIDWKDADNLRMVSIRLDPALSTKVKQLASKADVSRAGLLMTAVKQMYH